MNGNQNILAVPLEVIRSYEQYRDLRWGAFAVNNDQLANRHYQQMQQFKNAYPDVNRALSTYYEMIKQGVASSRGLAVERLPMLEYHITANDRSQAEQVAKRTAEVNGERYGRLLYVEPDFRLGRGRWVVRFEMV